MWKHYCCEVLIQPWSINSAVTGFSGCSRGQGEAGHVGCVCWGSWGFWFHCWSKENQNITENVHFFCWLIQKVKLTRSTWIQQILFSRHSVWVETVVHTIHTEDQSLKDLSLPAGRSQSWTYVNRKLDQTVVWGARGRIEENRIKKQNRNNRIESNNYNRINRTE